jgi:serine/threonine protein kinase
MRVELAAPRTPFVPSLAWCALEVAARGAQPSPASDVVSLGLVTFHALAGASLWRAVDPAGRIVDPVALLRELGSPPRASERLAEIASGRPRSPLPAGFDAWLARCLAPSPSERFESAPKASRALASPCLPSLARTRAPFVPHASVRTPWKSARE